ncbi:MAG TPA: glycine oxidase ThiO [Candidatus Cryosericum sp.]|nr:glycine oxidase ThiO [Candidatus Cryosericum sp.]
MQRGTDLLVIGGGSIGLAVAREAARSGLSVHLLERNAPGGEATGASAGILAAQMDAHEAGPLTTLGLESRALWPEFLRELNEDSGLDVDLRTDGALVAALDDEEREEVDRAYHFQSGSGLTIERLDGAGLHAAEPALSRKVLGGLLLPHEWSLDPARLARSLVLAAGRSGVTIQSGEEAACLLVEGSRAIGVVTSSGEHRAAGAIVVAAGAWSGFIQGDGMTPPPSEPVRGQIVCFQAPDLIRRVLSGGGFYLVPRTDGRIVAGSTMERAGFDRSVTGAGLEEILKAARRLVPGLAEAAVRSTWAGLRPGAPDGLPVIGAGPLAGLYYASGHLRSGILLTPITARVVTRLVTGGDPGVDLAAFDPLRFQEGG